MTSYEATLGDNRKKKKNSLLTGKKNLWQNHTPEGATFCHEWIRVREGRQNKRHIAKERQRLMLTND